MVPFKAQLPTPDISLPESAAFGVCAVQDSLSMKLEMTNTGCVHRADMLGSHVYVQYIYIRTYAWLVCACVYIFTYVGLVCIFMCICMLGWCVHVRTYIHICTYICWAGVCTPLFTVVTLLLTSSGTCLRHLRLFPRLARWQ